MIAAVFAMILALEAAPACVHDRAAMLAMAPQAFDQDLKGGWRTLGSIRGCEAATADLILAYRTANADKVAAAGRNMPSMLLWHEAQLRAAAGQTQRAITLFKTDDGRSPAMAAYADATVAFLEHDRPALSAARERLAALPKPPGFDQSAADFKARFGATMSWPVNLDVVDGFVACFDRPYAQAYSISCRPATPP